MSFMNKKLFFALGLFCCGYSREFIIVVEQSGIEGFVSEYEITERSLVPTGRKKEIPYATQCDVSSTAKYFLVLTSPPVTEPAETTLFKIDLDSWEISDSLAIGRNLISVGGCLVISPASAIALVSDQNPASMSGHVENLGLIDLKTFRPQVFIPIGFPARVGKYIEMGSVFGLSSDIMSKKLIRGDPNYDRFEVLLEVNQLMDFAFDVEEKFCYVISKGSGFGQKSKVIKVDIEKMEVVKTVDIDLNSLSKIRITPDGKYFVFMNTDLFDSKLVRVPVSYFEESSETFLKLTDFPTIPLSFLPMDLLLSKNGKKAVIGTFFNFGANGKIYLVDVDAWEILQVFETSFPQTSVKSYIPAMIELEVKGSSIKEGFLTYSCYENTLEWRAAQNQDLSDVVLYRVICDSQLLKEVSGQETVSFFHCVPKKPDRLLYTIQGVNSLGEIVARGELLLWLGH